MRNLIAQQKEDLGCNCESDTCRVYNMKDELDKSLVQYEEKYTDVFNGIMEELVDDLGLARYLFKSEFEKLMEASKATGGELWCEEFVSAIMEV